MFNLPHQTWVLWVLPYRGEGDVLEKRWTDILAQKQMYKLIPHRIVDCPPHSSLRQGRCLFLVLCHRASCRGSTCDIDFIIRSITQNQVWLPQTNWYVFERLGGNFHPFEEGLVWSSADARQLIHLCILWSYCSREKTSQELRKSPH